MTVVVAVVVVLAAVVVVVALRSRRRADPVDSFRRQIDALSPEARRPTISQATPGDDVADSKDAAGEPPPDGSDDASGDADDEGAPDGA